MQKKQVELDVPEYDETDNRYREIFASLDKDGSGFLDKNEFHEFMKMIGKEARSEEIFEVIDNDRNGKIVVEEFLRYTRACVRLFKNNDIQTYTKIFFDAADTDKDGHLNMKEFVKFIKYCGGKINFLNKRSQFNEWDTDGNKKISFDEVMDKIEFHIKKGTLTL
ncbi:EF hand family protein [Histomonas meleagridis]|uniref:EF hand family protein n=1 Tax=Histomonas meleagridis TaxID=135588 RepID=UPI003559ACCE|nr:EF hand family protein [Histomonas meleagridis]KAH0805951.1 EF hand family protein [Histomonas meleagridis]